MRKVAVLVCNSGLGHLRRVVALLQEWERLYPGFMQAQVFVDGKKLAHFSEAVEALQKKGVVFHDFNAAVLDYERRWMAEYAAVLGGVDYIWSDNCTFPLKHRREVIVTGSFIWSDVLDAAVLAGEEELLRRQRPVMIGSEYFATPRVKALTDFRGVGLYERHEHAATLQKQILVSCGKTEGAGIYFQKYIKALRECMHKEGLDMMFWMEPEFMGHFEGMDHVRSARFDKPMYAGLTAAVIRPGLGSTSDVLAHGGHIFAFNDGDNFEIAHNMDVLAARGIGQSVADPVEGLRRAVGFAKDVEAQGQHHQALRGLRGGGLKDTVDIMKGIIG